VRTMPAPTRSPRSWPSGRRADPPPVIGTDEEFDALAELMAEPPGGLNSGTAASRLTYGDRTGRDGLEAPTTYRTLDAEAAGRRTWASSGAVSVVSRTDLRFHGSRGYEPGEHTRSVAASEWQSLDGDALRAAVLARLGITGDELALLDRPGRDSAAVAALRVRLEDRLLALQENGARMADLARCLGWPVGAHGSARVTKACKRARARRDACGA
jgi:hypothetical protein